MKAIERIRIQLATGRYTLTRHALRRAVERNISERDIRESGSLADIIEEYPEDKYSPSCLLLGFTDLGRPLHLHVSRADVDMVKIITLYEPQESEWLDYTTRR
jgi:hypothetical protein